MVLQSSLCGMAYKAGQFSSDKLTLTGFGAFGLPPNFLPSLPALRGPLLKSDLCGLSGVSKPWETEISK